jgi:hypothetical protein
VGTRKVGVGIAEGESGAISAGEKVAQHEDRFHKHRVHPFQHRVRYYRVSRVKIGKELGRAKSVVDGISSFCIKAFLKSIHSIRQPRIFQKYFIESNSRAGSSCSKTPRGELQLVSMTPVGCLK